MDEQQLDLFTPPPPRLPTGDGDCPGYDVCPIGLCGCRWLGLGTPWREDKNDEQTANE